MNYLYKSLRQPILQQKVYLSQNEAYECDLADIFLIQDQVTGIVSNVKFDPSRVVYDSSYECDQSVSLSFKNHIDDVITKIKEHIIGKKIIEVGCGKGYLVNLLYSNGYNIIGFDKSYNGDKSYIIKSFFDNKSKVKGDFIILRHVLEHIKNPINFLFELKKNNNNKGLIYIEVPCLEWILKTYSFFDITYEHVNYFTISNFRSMFSNITDIGHCFNGQYIYLIADLESLQMNNYKIKPVIFPIDFLKHLKNHINKFEYPLNKCSAIWGAGGKGVQYSVAIKNWFKKFNLKGNVDYIIDNNPAKQNKYVGYSGCKIISPTDALDILPEGSNIIIMNPNYEREIIEMSKGKFKYFLAQ